MAEKWRFYVYDILDSTGNVVYVGKGSGDRCRTSMRQQGGVSVCINAYFKRECDAYAYEVVRIAEIAPTLNRHAGGNGSRATPAPEYRPDATDKLIAQIGTRAYAARLLLRFAADQFSASKVDFFRKVGYGQGN